VMNGGPVEAVPLPSEVTTPEVRSAVMNGGPVEAPSIPGQ